MALSLSDFTKFNNIVVQCHDNPDADALASGYALTTYLKSQGKDVRFVYGGKFPIQKANLLLMTERLEIPAEYVTSIDKPELLIRCLPSFPRCQTCAALTAPAPPSSTNFCKKKTWTSIPTLMSPRPSTTGL